MSELTTAKGQARAAPRRSRSPIRVLLVDDHQLVAQAIERYLDARDDITVIGVAGSVAQLAGFSSRPDVVLMDYALPDGTGAEATRIAKARWPRVRVVMLTGSAGNHTTLETMQAGADGFLTKGRALDDVVSAVRAVAAGEILLPASVIGDMAERLHEAPRLPPLARALTGRELEVLRHLAAGSSSRAIAADLNLSPETVRTHVQAIRRKLGATSRLEAVATALRRGIIEPPGSTRVSRP